MNVLIYGLGSIASKHISQLKSLYPNNLYLYAFRSGKGAGSIEGVEDIFEESELPIVPDFILICNPTYLHEETIKRAIVFKCPLFIEKPVLFSLNAASEIAADLQRNSIVTYVACNLRFHPGLRYLKEQLELKGEKCEEVNIYCGSYLPDWRPNDFSQYYSAHAEQGGGVHLDLIHELDYCYWLFGQPSKVQAVRKNDSHLQISAADYGHFVLEYDFFVATVTLNYYRRTRKRTLEVLTASGTWLVDLVQNKVYFDDVLVQSFNDFSVLDTYRSQLAYFLECMQLRKRPMNSFAEAVEVLKIALA